MQRQAKPNKSKASSDDAAQADAGEHGHPKKIKHQNEQGSMVCGGVVVWCVWWCVGVVVWWCGGVVCLLAVALTQRTKHPLSCVYVAARDELRQLIYNGRVVQSSRGEIASWFTTRNGKIEVGL